MFRLLNDTAMRHDVNEMYDSEATTQIDAMIPILLNTHSI